MRLFRWGNALEAFRDLQQEMDRLLESVNLATDGLRYGQPYPPTNIYDAGAAFLITVELPGLNASDVEISLANGVLTMKGERGANEGVPGDQYRRCERPRGSWERQFALPERVEEEGIRADLRNGILVLKLPKSPSTQPRQIPVNGGATAVGASGGGEGQGDV